MKTLAFLAVLTAIIAIYAVVLRPWLRTQEWAAGWFKLVDPIERLLYNKSESLLWSRFLVAFGFIPGLLTTFAGFDFTPFIEWIPEKYRPWLFAAVTLAGIIGEALRRDTTKPLDVVALPEVKTPEQQAVVNNIEQANKLAEVVIKEAPTEVKVEAAAKSDAAGTEALVEVQKAA